MTAQAPVRTEQRLAPAQVAEHTAWSTPGIKVLVAGIVGVLAAIALGWDARKQAGGTATALAWAGAILLIAAVLLLAGTTPVEPRQARVIQLFRQVPRHHARPGCSGSTRLPAASRSPPGSATTRNGAGQGQRRRRQPDRDRRRARLAGAGHGHARRCVVDGSEHFPRLDPAVIMLVTDPDDRCLLARNAMWPERRVSILAGFVEPGESAEQAVAREVPRRPGSPSATCATWAASPGRCRTA